jgi:hypothetical protein
MTLSSDILTSAEENIAFMPLTIKKIIIACAKRISFIKLKV